MKTSHLRSRAGQSVRALLLVIVLGAGLISPIGPDVLKPASAQVQDPAGEIIPQPNSGREPEHNGDRGGTLQVALFGLIMFGMGTIAVFVRRDMRKSSEGD